jgi:hypothetical protein
MNYAPEKRSRFCHLITNLHVASEKELARRDCCGVAACGVFVVLLAEIARLLLAAH